MINSGFIKIDRKITEWRWYSDANTIRVFLHLLLIANYEDKPFEKVIIRRGEAATSYDAIAQKLNLSIRNVRTALNHLKSTGEVTVKVTRRFSIVTIENWEKYQCIESVSDKQSDNLTVSQVSAKRQASDNIKEIKNIRNKEDKKYSPYQNGRNPDFIALLEMESKGAVNK